MTTTSPDNWATFVNNQWLVRAIPPQQGDRVIFGADPNAPAGQPAIWNDLHIDAGGAMSLDLKSFEVYQPGIANASLAFIDSGTVRVEEKLFIDHELRVDEGSLYAVGTAAQDALVYIHDKVRLWDVDNDGNKGGSMVIGKDGRLYSAEASAQVDLITAVFDGGLINFGPGQANSYKHANVVAVYGGGEVMFDGVNDTINGVSPEDDYLSNAGTLTAAAGASYWPPIVNAGVASVMGDSGMSIQEVTHWSASGEGRPNFENTGTFNLWDGATLTINSLFLQLGGVFDTPVREKSGTPVFDPPGSDPDPFVGNVTHTITNAGMITPAGIRVKFGLYDDYAAEFLDGGELKLANPIDPPGGTEGHEQYAYSRLSISSEFKDTIEVFELDITMNSHGDSTHHDQIKVDEVFVEVLVSNILKGAAAK